MKGISLRNGNGNGIPFLSSFATSSSGSAITVRDYTNTINFEKVKCLDDAKYLCIPVDGVILGSVINSYCLMHRADCAFSVLPIFLKNGIPFDVVMFTNLIRGFFHENKVKDAVELFKKLVRQNICEPDNVMYATVMNGLSKRGHTQKTLSLLRYSIVVDALCKDRNLDAAISLLNEMKQKDIPPNILGQWEKVKTLFSEMVSLNIYPNVQIFNILIDGLCKERKVEDAKEVMKHMVEKGVEPNIITYNAIIDGYCLRGQLDRVRRIFDSLIDKGIEPSIISYNILINGYCKKKELAKALQLFCEISHKGSKPSTVTYNTNLQGLFEVGRIGSAREIYAEMLSTGPIPDLYTHGTLLNGYFKHGFVEEAMSLFNKLERKREDTNVAIYNVVINGLCKNSKLDEAHAIFEKLSSMGLLPNARTYNTMKNGFCLEGLLDKAKDMIRQMEDNGCLPDNVTYNLVLQGFLRCDKISEMTTFMKEMAGRGFSLDATATTFLVDIVRDNPSVLDMIPELHLENKK
ncbi:hypothetical protein H5410_030302 [Solanum commersonii]|uniref:PPR1 protein n=1 Tax=Solanum commersonii TaxID=4109 RepID=A0A9J5YIA0_SOLCO|nr:hypothetical protein H5410_030302 [Solanum commersonii]